MCGIIGCVGQGQGTVDTLLQGLSNLEYRGYDSAGIALGGESVAVRKREGELANLRDRLDGHSIADDGPGIGHTRWSTHGPPSDRNAHPHTDERGEVAVVHNGIIGNHRELRDDLRSEGITFSSDTDSEVVPHLISNYRDRGQSPEAAFEAAVDRLDGSYALAAVIEGVDAVFVARNDSPVVIGVGEEGYYVASDVPAFLDYTRDVMSLEEGETAVLRPTGVTVAGDGGVVERDTRTVDWTAEETGKSGYDHFMLKEIDEQPRSLRRCLRGRIDDLAGEFTAEALADVPRPESVQLVACGTSYHAALYGATLLRDADIPATASLASEYATAPPPIPARTLVVGVTQSGETADTIHALREARERGAGTLALTNVVESTAARECEHVLPVRAGPEIGVAATKTFSSQLIALNLLVEHLIDRVTQRETRDRIDALRALPEQVQRVLDGSMAADVAEQYVSADTFLFLGRGLQYPVALEGALKFKEITYKRAEGFAAGELKHGPLALVTEETPVFGVVTGDTERARKTLSNIKEVEARGAPVIVVTDGKAEAERYADRSLMIPEAPARIAAVLATVQLQLVAYHAADELGRSIDKPRNLAKSVTVE